MAYRKRIAILAVLIAVLLAQFWLGSRYPAIDEKAAMAGEVVMGDVLSFDAAIRVSAADPLWQKIGKSTVNWIMTNRQGMTFGVLLASLVLSLLQLLRRQSGSGHVFRDALKGVLIGAPLGVCVNCAAPIAFGMRKEGMASGTSLATMFASPTLNIIVLTMTFSLLPLYMAVTKVVVTVAFLLLVLPVMVRWQSRRETDSGLQLGTQPPACQPPGPAESWRSAVTGLVPDLWRNFLFIVVRTVPLMLLAGLLGATLANLVPLESMAGWTVTLKTMALVALLGTFAPVPIAFDVVVVQALLAAGLPPQYAMVLLFTLGIFSIYPLLLVGKMHSLRFASQLFVAVSALGLASGYLAGSYEHYQAQRDARIFDQRFAAQPGETAPAAPAKASQSAGPKPAAVVPGPVTRQQLTPLIQLESSPFRPRSPAGELAFSHQPGSALGLDPAEVQTLDFMLPFSQGRGLAAGDYDHDGWPDLAVANNSGVMLYRNIEGRRFVAQPLDIPELNELNVLLTAFVDIDNNGCLDLFVGAFGASDYFVMNDCQGFARPRLLPLAHERGLMTQAAAFADIDRDGDLDVLKGNWFFLIPRQAPSQRATNYLAVNHGGGQFSQSALDEIVGETLTVAWSDLDGDGLADMFIGNDYMEPDVYYQGRSEGGFTPLGAGGPVPVSTMATMSFDTADIDNDLKVEVFLSGKVNDFSMRRGASDEQSLEQRRQFVINRREDYQQRYCARLSAASDRERCEYQFVLADLFRLSRMDHCLDLPDAQRQDECLVTLRIKKALVRRDWKFCAQIPASEFPVHREVCDAYAAYDAQAESKELGDKYLGQGAIDQTDQGNVFLVRQEDGRFAERSEAYGLFDAYWAWNARFADLDQDEWQDLYVVNGWWLETSMYSNVFFHNQQGQRFEARQQEFGLGNDNKQHAYVYTDLDRDGDLDIISRSLDGSMDVFTNNSQQGSSLSFEFRDEQSNHFGIGNKVTIYYGAGNERHQMREIKAGGGFVSFDAPYAHFGLGEYAAVNRVVIDWSEGGQTTIEQQLASGHQYVIRRIRSGNVQQTVVAGSD